MRCVCCGEEMQKVMADLWWCSSCRWQHYEMGVEEITVVRLVEHVKGCGKTKLLEIRDETMKELNDAPKGS